MIALNILLGVAAGIAFLYAIGDTKGNTISKERRQTAAIAFVALLLFIVALNTIMR